MLSNRLCSTRRRRRSVVPHENLRAGSVFPPGADVRLRTGRGPSSESQAYVYMSNARFTFKGDFLPFFRPPEGSRADRHQTHDEDVFCVPMTHFFFSSSFTSSSPRFLVLPFCLFIFPFLLFYFSFLYPSFFLFLFFYLCISKNWE